MNIKIKEKVFSFFNSKGKLPGKSEEEMLKFHYLDSGFIDSFGIIELVTVFEEEFGIHFSAEDLESAEFRTVGGLIELISRLTFKG